MLNIILYQPEKPQNTGNIMRTCSAIGAKLHIIGPLSYEINDQNLRRAGMDYIDELDYKVYKDYEEFIKEYKDIEVYYVTRYGLKTYSDNNYKTSKDLYFMFGKESTGIPKDILKAHLDHCIRLPMKVDARSLNLSNCVAIIAYEALRQNDFYDLATLDYLKGEDFLENYKETK